MLCSSSAGTSIDTTPVSFPEWTPPQPSEIQQSKLPSWLTGDDDTDDDLDFDLDATPAFTEEGSYAKLTELDLKRQLVEKDMELLQVEAQLELEAARHIVDTKQSEAMAATDTDKQANLNMELVEAQFELEWKEKEVEAGNLKQELYEMEHALEQARIGVLNHPQVGELLDRSDILTRIESACDASNPSRIPIMVDPYKAATPPNMSLAIVQSASRLPLPASNKNDAHREMLCDAAAVKNIADSITGLRAKAATLATKDGLMETDLAGWKEQQLARQSQILT